MSIILKRFISLSLTFLIGFTSVGFSADLHFCQGNLKSLSLFGTAKSCHEITTKSSCHKAHDTDKESASQCKKDQDKDCCKNERFLTSFEFDAIHQLQNTETETFKNEGATLHSFISGVGLLDREVNLSHITPYKQQYAPPLYGNELRVAHQSFLC